MSQDVDSKQTFILGITLEQLNTKHNKKCMLKYILVTLKY